MLGAPHSEGCGGAGFVVAVFGGGGGAACVVGAGAGGGGGAGELDVAATGDGAAVDGESVGDALADESSTVELAVVLAWLAGDTDDGAMQAAPPSTTATASPAAAPPLRTAAADVPESREICSTDLINMSYLPPSGGCSARADRRKERLSMNALTQSAHARCQGR